MRVLIAVLLAISLPVTAQQIAAPDPPPIVVQGAMPVEVEKLVARLDDVKLEQVGGWRFWSGRLDGYPVVVSRTMKGVANAGAATALAAERYRPRLYDIVLGVSSVSLSAFKSPHRPAGTGSNPLEWTVLDLMASEGSAGDDPNAIRVARFRAEFGTSAEDMETSAVAQVAGILKIPFPR